MDSMLHALRNMFPGIMAIDSDYIHRLEVENIQQNLERFDVVAWMRGLYYDVQRAKKREFRIEGWNHRNNLLKTMVLEPGEDFAPDIPQDVLDATHEMIVRAYGWFGVGVWCLAEEYFQIALSLSVVSNNSVAALSCAANLGMCYLAAGNYGSAVSVSNHSMAVAFEIKDYGKLRRMSTIKQLCFIYANDEQRLVKEIGNPFTERLDSHVYEVVGDIYKYLGNSANQVSWEINWHKLNQYRGQL